MRKTTLPALAVLLSLAAVPSVHAQFPLKDGDIWVMAGDSITAQHLHSNYFEAFCYARYPKMKFAFRNSGVGGHTIPSTLARFEYDIAAWKPTVVSVELGMNDKGGTDTPKFIANMETMVKRIRGINARPVIFAPSPVNDGGTMANLAGNKRLNEYCLALKELCARDSIPYGDQFHAVIDIWGKNKKFENLVNTLPMLKNLAKNDDIAGVDQLRAFLKAQEMSTNKLVSMQGDAVHPGPPGQLMMAAALLKGLGAEPFVSMANVNPATTTFKGCTITNTKWQEKGGVSFDRLDECLPFPIPEEARSVLPLYPTILGLSQYTLKVTGLHEGTYLIKVNGGMVARLTAKELEDGVNLTGYGSDPKSKVANPIAAQGKAVLAAVSARAGLVGQWRNLSKQAHADNAPAGLMSKLAAMTKTVEEADVRIREAAQPKVLHFELTPQ